MLLRALILGTAAMAVIGLGLGPGVASAASLVRSEAYATSDEEGEDPGTELDEDETSTPGAAAQANTFRCPGTATCAFDPQNPAIGARAFATTDFGINRATARAAGGYDASAENNVSDSADAASLWISEWTLLVLPGGVGKPVSLQFELDGAWDRGGATFDAMIADSTQVPPYDPDDLSDPVIKNAEAVASLSVDTTEDTMFLFSGAQNPIIPFPEGGQEAGQVDRTFVLSFVPVSGRMYLVGARLRVGAGDPGGDSFADFGGTAELTRVILPEGVSFTSDVDVAWPVEVVPEPGTAVLLALGTAALGFAGRRRPH